MNNYNTYNIKAAHFVKEMIPKIYIDRQFQRKVCWDGATCRSFIYRCNKGQTSAPIVLADAIEGKTHSKNHHDDRGQKRYEEAHKNKKTYISLDGQNRSEALRRLFDNELTLTGTYIDADDKSNQVENKLFKDLPKRLQDAFRDMDIGVKVMPPCKYEELHDIFIDLQSTYALNHQELRNALSTDIAGYIRDVAEDPKFKDMWLKSVATIDEQKVKRSLDAEWTAKAYMASLPNSYAPRNLNKDDVDKFYKLGVGKSNVDEYKKDNQARFFEILQLVATLVESGRKQETSSKVPQKIWWLSVYVAARLYDNAIVINDYSELYSIIRDLDQDLEHKDEKRFVRDIDSWERAGKPEDRKPSKNNYYAQWARDPADKARRAKRKNEFFNALDKEAKYIDLVMRSNPEFAVAA